MNRHFEDARYYLGRAVETAAEGVREELEPVEERFTEMTGRDDDEAEPELTGLEAVQEDLRTIEQRAEGEALEAIESAREQIRQYRSSE